MARRSGSSTPAHRYQLHQRSRMAASSLALRTGDFTASVDRRIYFQKYFAIVASAGLRVISETPYIRIAEMITIGTTGMNPKTAVPPGVRVSTSHPPSLPKTTDGPGAGAGTKCWNNATANTENATHTVTAKAPHFVLPFQKRAATKRGESAANPENAY